MPFKHVWKIISTYIDIPYLLDNGNSIIYKNIYILFTHNRYKYIFITEFFVIVKESQNIISQHLFQYI